MNDTKEKIKKSKPCVIIGNKIYPSNILEDAIRTFNDKNYEVTITVLDEAGVVDDKVKIWER